MKRFSGFVIALLLCLNIAVPAFGAVETNADEWAAQSIEIAYEAGFLPEESLQKAKSQITRREFGKMAVDFLETVTGQRPQATQESPFNDCSDADITAAYEAGIIGGIEKGVFGPERVLTREQMAIMIARTLKVCDIDMTADAKLNPFSDTAELWESSNLYINQLYGANIISGYDDGTFQPFQKLTTQEAVIAFVRAYRYAQENMTPYIPEEPPLIQFPDEPEDDERPEEEEPLEPVKIDRPSEEEMRRVTIGKKSIELGWSPAQLRHEWGVPDRIDETVYSMDRYVYLNSYRNVFFATFDEGKIVEIFIPGKDFTYLEMNGDGTSADIQYLDYISAAEHSGVIKSDETETRIPLDYAGNISGILLQTAEFVQDKNPMSVLHLSLKEDLEAEFVDLIQYERRTRDLPLLMVDEKMGLGARTHCDEMVLNHYFAYNSLDGRTPFARIAETGKTFSTATEVIAQQRGDIVNIYQEWIRTASRINGLMDGSMQEVGVGVAGSSKILHVTVDLCGRTRDR